MQRPWWKKKTVRKGLIIGIVVLLAVDVLWVSSAGLTKYLFTRASYEKPFFTTYFKTCLFSIYLTAFIFWRPWQQLCCCCVGRSKTRRKWGVACEREGAGSRRRLSGLEEEEEEEGDLVEGGEVGGAREKEGGAGMVGVAQGGLSFAVGGGGAPEDVDGAKEAVGEVVCNDNSQNKQSPDAVQVVDAAKNDDMVTVYIPCDITNANTSSTSHHKTTETWPRRRPLKFSPRVPSMEKCPLLPDHDVCLLGPPELEPLCCDLSDLSERERDKGLPISPCLTKCCKVRFRPTVEIREMKGKASSPTRRFDKTKDTEKFVRKGPVDLLPVHRVLVLSLVFGILWFFANYLYGLALDHTSVAMVNTLSASSGVFVMCLTALPFLTTFEGDKFTFPRCLVTLISVLGAVMVSLSPSGEDEKDKHHKLNAGALLALGGALLYALYLVLLRKMVKETDSLEIPMFFGFVGLIDFILLFPLLLIWHYSGLEVFEWPPPNVWTLLLINGFVGTVLSELLWLWGVFLTSPLLGTLALSLVTPLSITYSIVVGKASFSWLFAFGAALIVLGFVGVAVLDHLGTWDPIWGAIKRLYSQTRDSSSRLWVESVPPESQQLLPDSPSMILNS